MKGVFKIFSKLAGKQLCLSLFYNKVAGLNPATLLKKRLWHRCFPVNFEKFLRTPFLQNTSGWLHHEEWFDKSSVSIFYNVDTWCHWKCCFNSLEISYTHYGFKGRGLQDNLRSNNYTYSSKMPTQK